MMTYLPVIKYVVKIGFNANFYVVPLKTVVSQKYYATRKNKFNSSLGWIKDLFLLIIKLTVKRKEFQIVNI